WAGCMSLPRLLALNAQSDLEMQVAPQAEVLRAKAFPAINASTASEARRKILASIEIQDVAGELIWQTTGGPFSMALRERTGPWWLLNSEIKDTTTVLHVNDKKIELPAQTSQKMKFHLVLDASVAEFFCNSLHVLTSRIYRKPVDLLRLQLSEANAERLQS